MLHDKVVGKLEIQENNFFLKGKIFSEKILSCLTIKSTAKRIQNSEKRGMNRLVIMQAVGLLTDSMRQDRFLSSL